ncbi:MAG: exosome complex RNA-binding protein Rrp4 [Promethearchaeota archaeon]
MEEFKPQENEKLEEEEEVVEEQNISENLEVQRIDDFEEDEDVERELVVPGEVLTEDVENFLPGRGTILNDKRNKIISLHIGLKQIKKNYVNVIPLRGLYTPQPGDKVIGVVVDKNPVKYKLDINAKDYAQLKPKNTIKKGKLGRSLRLKGNRMIQDDLTTNRFDIGDVLIVKIISANRLNKPELTTIGKYLGKKNSGIVITIDPPKIPRIIGRNGSMIKMLKNLTKCNIFVTQNGRIWLRGENPENERLLIKAIQKIEREAHTIGLTDRIQAFIEKRINERGVS